MRLLAPIAVTLSLLAAACSSSSDPAAITIGADESSALASWSGSGMTEAEKICIISEVVGAGVDLAAMAADDLTPTEDGVIAVAVLGCIDDPSQIDRLVQPLVDELAAAGTPVTFEQGRCAIAAIAAMDSDTGDGEPSDGVVLTPEAAEAILACMEQAGPGAIDTYGDDPGLDALWDSCAAGDNSACDDLYELSPLVSGYEDFGRTCGGALPDSIGFRCVEELDA